VKRWLGALALILLLTACDYGAEQENAFRPPGVGLAENASGGKELYMRDCAWCHGRDGTGTDERGPQILTGTNGPAFLDFVLSSGRMPLERPDQRMQRGDTIYSDTEIDEIVAYVESLGTEGPDIPTLALEDADLAHGGVLYQENCAACHSTTGIGGALTEGSGGSAVGPDRPRIVIPPVTDGTPVEIAEAIRVGPGDMPVFGDETFDDEDLDAIVAYVEYLKDPDDRGGASFGRIGPVVEGAVGWIIGLGLLLIFIRWIGTKRGDP
jgi:ubiquinol-cytochrome c reductase cytochrome c subunit